jgi:hypothetical protein
MASLFMRLGNALGIATEPTASAVEDLSPMQKHQQIDVVSHDPKTDRVVLSLVETRSWGEHGALLPDLQEKVNAYLNYVEGGQLWRDYPAMKGKKVAFRLHSQFPPTPRECDFVDIVKRKYLDSLDVIWLTTGLGNNAKAG